MNIIDTIDNKDQLENLYNKTYKFYKEIKEDQEKWSNKHVAIPFLINSGLPFIFFTYFIYIEVSTGDYSIGSGVFLSILTFACSVLGSFLIGVLSTLSYIKIIGFINKYIKKEKLESKSAYQIQEERYEAAPKINQKIKKYEDDLNKLESYYFNNYKIFKKSSYKEMYFEIFQDKLKKAPAEILINNKEIIIKEIKDNFELKKQKNLLKLMTNVIKENTIDEEVLDLEEAIEKNLKQKESQEKLNLIKKNNIIQEI